MLVEVDLPRELSRIRDQGFVRSLRTGDTGIGYTIETLLGLPETNIAGPDCLYKGIPVELKAHRGNTSSMITLFTKEPIKGTMNDKRLIEKYGYVDFKGRNALKVTLRTHAFNPQGLKIVIEKDKDQITLIDENNKRIWKWLISDLKPKVQNIVFIFAKSKKINYIEHFLIEEAHFLGQLDISRFFNLIEIEQIRIDLRMHLKLNGSVRNRGTAFRLKKFPEIIQCYEKYEKLL